MTTSTIETEITPTIGLDERLVEAAIGTLELFSIHLGRRLGLYTALDRPTTASELSSVTGVDLRYAREWLEQQAVAGFITTDPRIAEWDQRSFWLSEDQAATFVVADNPAHVSPLADMVVGVSSVIDQLADAYLTGAGVPFADYGRWLRDGQAGINRPAFTHDLVDSWVGAVPDVVERLEGGGRIVDLGCGAGWSTIALAKRFPGAEVVGVDSDRASIADAIDNGAAHGSSARFVAVDAGAQSNGDADLVVILEALHDMAQPVEVLRAARSNLAPGGALLVADEKVQEAFTAPGDELERMMYGWSVVHCLPAALAEEPSAAIGTVIRPDLVDSLAREAGFTSVERSDIDAGFFNLYVLRG